MSLNMLSDLIQFSLGTKRVAEEGLNFEVTNFIQAYIFTYKQRFLNIRSVWAHAGNGFTHFDGAFRHQIFYVPAGKMSVQSVLYVSEYWIFWT